MVQEFNSPPDGDSSVARLIVQAYRMGWRRFAVYHCKGDRFIVWGLGADSRGVRIEIYGSSGDYLGSGLDGAEVFVHGDAQDQVGQILKSGRIVVHGMVGQTFLYGAKGGAAFVLGNAAGRPLINAVGNMRAIINGVEFAERGNLKRFAEPYPGGNFFSLASGGAGYIADPDCRLTDDQLNEASFVEFRDQDWQVIEPYLRENAEYFGLSIEALLEGREPRELYRKVSAAKRGAVAKAEEVGE